MMISSLHERSPALRLIDRLLTLVDRMIYKKLNISRKIC